MLGGRGLDQQAYIGCAGCRHLRAAHSPGPRTVRLLMQQAVQQQAAVPFAASASCRRNHPGHDGHRRDADVRRCEFRPAASGAESDTWSNPDFMRRTGPTYLGVRAGGGLAKSWSQRLRINGKPCNLGLGRYPIVTLAEARDKALENARAVPREASRATARVSLRSSKPLPGQEAPGAGGAARAQAGAAAQGRPGPQASAAGRGKRREQRDPASGAGDAGRAVLNRVSCFAP